MTTDTMKTTIHTTGISAGPGYSRPRSGGGGGNGFFVTFVIVIRFLHLKGRDFERNFCLIFFANSLQIANKYLSLLSLHFHNMFYSRRFPELKTIE